MKKRRARKAFTLVELLVAITILAILSTAVVMMLRSAANVTNAVTASMAYEMEVETALLRIIQNVRMCTSVFVPSGATGGNTFSLVTQADPANNNATYPVTYSLIVAADGTRQLEEIDSRYGASTLIRDVQSFDVRYTNASGPTVILLTFSVGKNPPVVRTVKIAPRNQQ